MIKQYTPNTKCDGQIDPTLCHMVKPFFIYEKISKVTILYPLLDVNDYYCVTPCY